MKTLRIAQAALATVLAVGINSTTYAFMAEPVAQGAEVQMNLSETIDALRAEIASGETSCKEMLAKLDGVLEQIDAKLDEGVVNEDEYLAARDAVTKMRHDLECLAQELADIVPGDFGGGAPMVGAAPDFGGAPCCNGGGATGGSIGGGGMAVGRGGGLGGLVTIGLIGGAFAAIADDDSNPGFIASGSDTSTP